MIDRRSSVTEPVEGLVGQDANRSSVQGLPDDVRRFIRECIDSVELLHVLLMLRDNEERRWTPELLSAELRSSPQSIGRRLEHLRQHRLAVLEPDGYRYGATRNVDRVVQRLADLYRERRTTIIDVIFSTPADPLQSFSDAFKVRGPDGDR